MHSMSRWRNGVIASEREACNRLPCAAGRVLPAVLRRVTSNTDETLGVFIGAGSGDTWLHL